MVENGKLTGEVARPILGREAKVEALLDISAASASHPKTPWPSATAPTISA